MNNAFDAILFDLLTGLLDSWSLWNRISRDAEAGRRWRLRYLELCYGAGRYRAFESLIAEAAVDVGLPESLAPKLISSWDQLDPWPEVSKVLPSLGIQKIGVVTNCSEALAQRATRRVGVGMSVVVSAERAGAYKPDPKPYRLALSEIDVQPERALFVAGSPSDIMGASRVGMPVFWHNRLGLVSDLAGRAEVDADNLWSLREWLLADKDHQGER